MISSIDKFKFFNFNEEQSLAFKNMKKPNPFSKEECEIFNLELDNKNPEFGKEEEINEENLKIILETE